MDLLISKLMVHLQTTHIDSFLQIDFKRYMLSYDLKHDSIGEWTTVEESDIPSGNVLKNLRHNMISKFNHLFYNILAQK